MSTKFGFDQTASPAPMWWRRLQRTIISGVAPALTVFLPTVITDPAEMNKALQWVVFGVALVQAVGIFMGTDQTYEGEPVKKAEDPKPSPEENSKP